MPIEELTLNTPFLQLKARVWGPENGIPVLALHGWLDNANSFAPVAPLLPKFRLVAIDLPGQGISQWKARGSHYHFIDFCADVLFAADALGWEKFNILGHSFGGAIGLVTACMAKERVDKLGLIDNFGPRVDTGEKSLMRLRNSFRDLSLVDKKKVTVFKQRSDAIRVRQLVGGLNDNNTQCLLERGLKSVDDGFVWSSDPQLKMTSPSYLHELQLLSYLEHLDSSCLLIRAESGHLVNRIDLDKRYDIIKDLRIVDVTGGHHVHMEHPNIVASYLNQFFLS
ncbi:MAG: alpha/beta hydrolase [Gammaproteobacteria bacterium]|nr:alpha/beta hydrolase [Gammaproteobacteria bacterium]